MGAASTTCATRASGTGGVGLCDANDAAAVRTAGQTSAPLEATASGWPYAGSTSRRCGASVHAEAYVSGAATADIHSRRQRATSTSVPSSGATGRFSLPALPLAATRVGGGATPPSRGEDDGEAEADAGRRDAAPAASSATATTSNNTATTPSAATTSRTNPSRSAEAGTPREPSDSDSTAASRPRSTRAAYSCCTASSPPSTVTSGARPPYCILGGWWGERALVD